jgi:hypothetical protein
MNRLQYKRCVIPVAAVAGLTSLGPSGQCVTIEQKKVVRTYTIARMPNRNGTHAPTGVKAAGLALLLQGVPCRKVQKALCQLFPDDPAPHYSTISRWLRYEPPSQRTELERWCTTLELAAKLIQHRLASPNLSTNELLTIYERMSELTARYYQPTL